MAHKSRTLVVFFASLSALFSVLCVAPAVPVSAAPVTAAAVAPLSVRTAQAQAAAKAANATFRKANVTLAQARSATPTAYAAKVQASKRELSLRGVVAALEHSGLPRNSASLLSLRAAYAAALMERDRTSLAYDTAVQEEGVALASRNQLYNVYVARTRTANALSHQLAVERARAKAAAEAANRLNVLRARVVAIAKSKVGSAYTWGGEGPNSFDCSGFTMWVYAQVGIEIPHYSGAQMTTSRARPVALNQMLPGDLMYFGSGGSRHVTLYIGNGQVVEATNPSGGVRLNPAFPDWQMYDYAGSTRLIY